MTVDEIGRSLIVLVPSCDTSNNCVTGKIEVTTLAGTVVLDQPYTATFTSQATALPIHPIKLNNITDKQINNMLIIAVPAEIRDALKEGDAQENNDTQNQQKVYIRNINIEEHAKSKVDNGIIIVEKQQGRLTAYTKNDVNNTFTILFGPNGGDATVNLQRGSETAVAKIGNSGMNTITIKQSK